MSTAKTVQQIAEDQAEHIIDTGIVRAIRGQYLDIVLDGTRKQIREVLLSNTITGIEVGWWVIVIRIPRTNRWVALSALETMGQGTTEALVGQPAPANVAATGKPYLVELYWEGSFKDVATYEVQHNSSASESGATMIKVEGSNYLYWCAPGTTRHFRVRAVASDFERSTWSDWVNATSGAGEAYMTVGVNSGATDVEYQAFIWSLVAAVTDAEMVHDHSADAEGGDLFPRWISVNATGVPDQEGAIALGSVAGDPSVIGGAGIIYAKDFSGIPELCYIDDAGNVVQITSEGGLPGVSDHGGLTGLTPDDDHPQYLPADGTRALSADWDIGDGRKIQADEIAARDGAGLKLYDDDGNGIFVEDGGNAGFRTQDPVSIVHVYAGDSGLADGSFNAATKAIIEGDDHAYLEIATPDNKISGILFSNATNGRRGFIRYSQSDDSMRFWTAGASRVSILSDGGILLHDIKSGATQAAAGAAANELWKTNGHATLPDNVVMIGV